MKTPTKFTRSLNARQRTKETKVEKSYEKVTKNMKSNESKNKKKKNLSKIRKGFTLYFFLSPSFSISTKFGMRLFCKKCENEKKKKTSMNCDFFFVFSQHFFFSLTCSVFCDLFG